MNALNHRPSSPADSPRERWQQELVGQSPVLARVQGQLIFTAALNPADTEAFGGHVTVTGAAAVYLTSCLECCLTWGSVAPRLAHMAAQSAAPLTTGWMPAVHRAQSVQLWNWWRWAQAHLGGRAGWRGGGRGCPQALRLPRGILQPHPLLFLI